MKFSLLVLGFIWVFSSGFVFYMGSFYGKAIGDYLFHDSFRENGLIKFSEKPKISFARHQSVVVAAGFTRSASTWQYSFLYHLAKAKKIPFLAFSSERLRVWPEESVLGKSLVIKSHHFDTKLLRLADFVVTSHRDLRDVLSSYIRKDFYECSQVDDKTYTKCLELMEAYFQHYLRWSSFADVDIKYEDWYSRRHESSRQMLQALGIPQNSISSKELEDLISNCDAVFHDPLRNDTEAFWFVDQLHHTEHDAPGLYSRFLDASLTDCVNHLYWDWLKSNSYKLPDNRPRPQDWCLKLESKFKKMRKKRFHRRNPSSAANDEHEPEQMNGKRDGYQQRAAAKRNVLQQTTSHLDAQCDSEDGSVGCRSSERKGTRQDSSTAEDRANGLERRCDGTSDRSSGLGSHTCDKKAEDRKLGPFGGVGTENGDSPRSEKAFNRPKRNARRSKRKSAAKTHKS
eukprot:TRINITY_DN653_c0_g1_i2.p1 TRINITY_DN653_c0_g1~~TRINITY_DN653_c0_g1_i2.p1  ORF type:complete len:456 (+),score=82.24 TRINITY_DN653_c0_g1_i2:910-2277(+)